MLLIHTPKHFYKTSISLSWLRRRGTHHGKQSKKIPLKEGGKALFLTKWIPSKCVIIIMLKKG